MSEDFWKFIAYGYLVCNGLAIIILLDILIMGKPYLTLFCFLFIVLIYFNLRLFNSSTGKRQISKPEIKYMVR